MEKEPGTVSQKAPFRKGIIAISIVLPVAIAALFKVKIEGYDFSFLPPIYATTNGITAILLVIAVMAIKNGKRELHENLIKLCMGLSAAFLVMYVAYHITSDPTPYGGDSPIRYVYYFILGTHI